MPAGNAWYAANRETFLKESTETIAAKLLGAAAEDGWKVEPEQHEEWKSSIFILKNELNAASSKVEIIKEAIRQLEPEFIHGVVLEYDFRRRGLRIDCILFATGTIFILEFKRSRLQAADTDQIMQYCVSLYEFHAQTRRLVDELKFNIVPILVLTEGHLTAKDNGLSFFSENWPRILRKPMKSDHENLHTALITGQKMRQTDQTANLQKWLESEFSPSSTILDAALSLYGNHDVSAIKEHQTPLALMKKCTAAILEEIDQALKEKRNHLIIISGSPGSGKTLVGLDIAFSQRYRQDAVFVTGNAPLVEVLQSALQLSYRGMNSRTRTNLTGYAKENFRYVGTSTTFKIVKAHNFLGQRGEGHRSSDGRILVFDEAQRTYEKGRVVLREKLEEHEAELIMQAQEKLYPHSVIIALLGQNQAINRGERGAIAWLEAAAKRDWTFAVADETMALPEFAGLVQYKNDGKYRRLKVGHLGTSLRFYRNQGIEEWAQLLLENNVTKAAALSQSLAKQKTYIYLTRDLNLAKDWVRKQLAGELRGGLIASAQGRRLAAEGIFVDFKPDIAKWMLAPGNDVRSSNMLETAQNQYQIQGLEMDYSIVCWDADLRWENGSWAAYKLNGSQWSKDSAIDIAKNGYRVLLTRSRKGMVIFVPRGDQSSEDETRNPKFYDNIAEVLESSGASVITE